MMKSRPGKFLRAPRHPDRHCPPQLHLMGHCDRERSRELMEMKKDLIIERFLKRQTYSCLWDNKVSFSQFCVAHSSHLYCFHRFWYLEEVSIDGKQQKYLLFIVPTRQIGWREGPSHPGTLLSEPVQLTWRSVRKCVEQTMWQWTVLVRVYLSTC